MMKLLLFFLVVAVDAAPCFENQRCVSCTGDGRCISECLSGYYGLKCNLTCSLGCRNNICKENPHGIEECIGGCKDGFYGTRCTTPCTTYSNTCRECPQECEGEFCQLGSTCAEGCQDSYYGGTCKSCPAGCKVCNRVSGTCEVCLHCEGNCTHGCLEGCKAGYFGNFCEKQCPNRCANEECDMDGICTLGCTLGWFGPRCDNECLASCVGDRCDRNGQCTDGCKLGFHGELCQKKCPEFCFNKLCDVEDGSCKSCKKSFYGRHCNNSCVRCIDGACSQDTGHCIQGCLSSYRGEFCQHDCTGDCHGDECREVCKTNPVIKNDSEGEVTSNYIPYTVAAVVVVILSSLVTYTACRLKRLQSVIYGYRKGGQGHQLKPQSDSAEVREPTVNFYCEIDDPSESPQLPSRCGTAVSASHHTLLQNRHECISGISDTLTSDNAKQKDDGTLHSEKGASSNLESASPSQAEQNVDDTVENQVDDVCTDLVLHAPARPNSYLKAFAPYIANINVEEVGQISVPIVQGKALQGFTRSHESCLSVPNIYSKASGFDAGPSNVKTETQNARVAVTNVAVNAHGADEVPFPYIDKSELQHRSSPDSTGYAKAQGLCTDTSQITTESSEDAEADERLSNISVPVIADCYDNFSVDDEEEGIPDPPPENYTKLFAINHVRK